MFSLASPAQRTTGMLLQKRSSRDGWAGSKGEESIFPPSNQGALQLKLVLRKKKIPSSSPWDSLQKELLTESKTGFL